MQDDYIDATAEVLEPAHGASAAPPERVVRTYASDVAALTGQAPPDSKQSGATTPPQEDRETILARLRSRANKSHEEPAPATDDWSAPVFDADQNTLNVERVPPLSRTAERTPIAKETFVPPAPIRPTPRVKEDTGAGLHTYKGDFAGRIEDKDASALSVLAAESDAPTRPATKPIRKTSVALVLFGIVILLIGAGTIYVAYGYMKTNNILPVVQTIPSLIFVDERQEITGVGHDLLLAFANSAQKPLADGAIRLVYASVSTTTAGIVSSTPAPGGALINAMQLPAPDILLRSIQPQSMIGIVHSGAEARPFFLLKVDSYERSFGGMLAWEPTLAQDLNLLYPAYPAPVVVAPVIVAPTTTPAVATTTSKTKKGKAPAPVPAPVVVAPPAPQLPQAPLGFKDAVVASHDVRVLKDTYGNTVLIYGYWNQSTLIIARDESAFAELVNRLATTRQQ